MKALKKLSCFALILVLILAMAAPALAADDGKITVTNPAPEQTYNLYRVFDLESFAGSAAGDAHAYKVNETWRAFVTSVGIKDVYVTIDAQDYVTWVENADAEAFAKAAILWAEGADAVTDAEGNEVTPAVPGHIATPDATKTAGTAAEPTEENPDPRAAAITFDNLPLGYYLISSTRGALCALDTTNKTADVTEKNEKPTVDKEATELPDGIGDSIPYKVTIHAKKGAEKYVLHDTMSTGLSFNNDVVVTVGETVVAADNYTVNTTGLTDACTFEVVFAQSYLDTLIAESTDIVVTYSATVTADAVEVDELTNKAHLNFGNESTPEETLPDNVNTPVYEFDLVKTKSDHSVLAGATFELRRAGATEPLQLVKLSENVYRLVAKDKDGNITDNSADIVTTVTTDNTGLITIKGLGKGDYTLTETQQPAGYNKLDGTVTVSITDKDLKATIENGKYKANVKAEDATPENPVFTNSGVEIINYNGTELPATGGIGTTIFYIVGGLLVVGACVLLVTRKRADAE